MRGGATYFTPVSERKVSSISNFAKWEQAFQIYSNILTQTFPSKAGKLIQYNHVIYTASLTFTWENVYLYDREFRMHLSKFLNRSWSVILQQAWSMCLKDWLKTFGEDNRGGPTSKKAKVNEPCKRYNRGKCTYGSNCRYEHQFG